MAEPSPSKGRPSLDEHGGDANTQDPTPEPLLIGERDAARMLSVSQRHLEALRRAGAVPHRRLGHRVLYAPDELRSWVASGCPRADTRERGGEA